LSLVHACIRRLERRRKPAGRRGCRGGKGCQSQRRGERASDPLQHYFLLLWANSPPEFATPQIRSPQARRLWQGAD